MDSWKTLYGSTITGHSARRSGALQYIRDGWPVSQVGYLGRWKSNVILEYAQEALESMAVNAGITFKPLDHAKESAALEKEMALLVARAHMNSQTEADPGKSAVLKLANELNSFKGESNDAVKGLETAKFWNPK